MYAVSILICSSYMTSVQSLIRIVTAGCHCIISPHKMTKKMLMCYNFLLLNESVYVVSEDQTHLASQLNSW